MNRKPRPCQYCHFVKQYPTQKHPHYNDCPITQERIIPTYKREFNPSYRKDYKKRKMTLKEALKYRGWKDEKEG